MVEFASIIPQPCSGTARYARGSKSKPDRMTVSAPQTDNSQEGQKRYCWGQNDDSHY